MEFSRGFKNNNTLSLSYIEFFEAYFGPIIRSFLSNILLFLLIELEEKKFFAMKNTKINMLFVQVYHQDHLSKSHKADKTN